MKAITMKNLRKMFNLTVLTLGAVTYLVSTTDIAAQGRNCAPRDVVLAQLATKYGETRQSIGLGSNNAVVEVFASDETGTWSITVTAPGGLTCLVASGRAFEEVADMVPAKDSDT
jgi:hypothetical protein